MASQKIYITIGGRRYPVVIEESEKKAITEIEKSINKKINQYISTYENLNMIDVLTLVLIDCRYELYSAKTDNGDVKKLKNELQKINILLDKELSL